MEKIAIHPFQVSRKWWVTNSCSCSIHCHDPSLTVIQFVIRMFKDWMHATLFKLHGITYKRQFFLQQPFLWCWLLWASTMRKREFADKMPVSQQMPLTAKILGFQLGLWDHLVLYWNRLKVKKKLGIWNNCLINPEYILDYDCILSISKMWFLWFLH